MEIKIDHYNAMPFLYAVENPSPCNNADDVIAKDVSQPSTMAIAWTKCAAGATYGGSTAAGTRWCKAQEFVWNKAFDSLVSSSSNKQMVACHEIGHTLGLRHRAIGNSTCMVSSTIDPPYVNPWTNTNAHDQNHLEVRYGS